MSVLIIFEIAGRASVVELLFSKITEEISAFCNSANNSITWINIFQKEAPLEISRYFLLTGVLGFQPTGSNSTKNDLLIKEMFLEMFSTIQWSSFVVNCRPTNYTL